MMGKEVVHQKIPLGGAHGGSVREVLRTRLRGAPTSATHGGVKPLYLAGSFALMVAVWVEV